MVHLFFFDSHFFCSFLLTKDFIVSVHNIAFAQCKFLLLLSMEAMEYSEYVKTKSKKKGKWNVCETNMTRWEPWINFNSYFLFGFLLFVLHHLLFTLLDIYDLTWRHHRHSFTLTFIFFLTEKFEEFLSFSLFFNESNWMIRWLVAVRAIGSVLRRVNHLHILHIFPFKELMKDLLQQELVTKEYFPSVWNLYEFREKKPLID